MSEQHTAVSNRSAEFGKETTYNFEKTIIIVDSIFRKSGQTINNILSRLIKADIDENKR